MSDCIELQLPHGWTTASLGDLAEYLNGVAFKPDDWKSEGIPIIRIQNLTDPSRRPNRTERKIDPRLLIRNGDLLFSWSATLDAFLWQGEDSWLNQHIFKVVPENCVHKRFLYYLLRYSVNEIVSSEHTHGSTMQHINRRPFLQHPVHLPPYPEQTRIAHALDELSSDLNAGVSALERVRDKLKLYRASVLKAAVEGTLTADWRKAHLDAGPASELLKRILAERRQRWEQDQLRKLEQKGKGPPKNWRTNYKEPVALDTVGLPVLPKNWCWSNLDTVIVKGPQNGLYLPSRKYGEGTEILRIDDFQNDWIRPRGRLKKVQAEEDTLETYALHMDDLVINRVNSLTHLGKCVIITEQLSGVLFESNMMRAKLAATCDAKYLQYYLHSDSGRRRLTQDAKWAVNQASINQQDVKKTPIPVPPLAEQEAIVEIVEGQLSVVNYLEAEVEAKLQNAQALRQAILRHAFTGKLVSQNPNDEPASELLKRISDQRDARAREAVAAKTLSRETANAHTTQSHSVKLRKEKID